MKTYRFKLECSQLMEATVTVDAEDEDSAEELAFQKADEERLWEEGYINSDDGYVLKCEVVADDGMQPEPSDPRMKAVRELERKIAAGEVPLCKAWTP